MGNKLTYPTLQKEKIINYYISHEDEQKLSQISSNSLSRLEWYLNTYFTKKIKLNKVQEDQENTLHIKHISYFSRAQQDNLSIEFLPNVSYLLMYQHGSDMSSIISNLPTNVGTVSLNSDGVKSYSNLEGILDQYLQKKKAASMLFIGIVLTFGILLFLLLLELNLLNSRRETKGNPCFEVYDDGKKWVVKVTYDKEDTNSMLERFPEVKEGTHRLVTNRVVKDDENNEKTSGSGLDSECPYEHSSDAASNIEEGKPNLKPDTPEDTKDENQFFLGESTFPRETVNVQTAKLEDETKNQVEENGQDVNSGVGAEISHNIEPSNSQNEKSEDKNWVVM